MNENYLRDRITESKENDARTVIVDTNFNVLHMNQDFITSFKEKFKFVCKEGDNFFINFSCFQTIQETLKTTWKINPSRKQTIDNHFHIDGKDKFIRFSAEPKVLDGVVVCYFFLIISQSAKKQKAEDNKKLEAAYAATAAANEELKSTNEELKAINDELVLTKSQLEQKNLELGQANDSKDQMFAIIGHDNRSPLGDALSRVSIIRMAYNSMDKVDINQYLLEAEEKLENAIAFNHNLQRWAQSQRNLIAPKAEPIKLDELILDQIQEFKVALSEKNIEIHTKGMYIAKNMNLISDMDMLKTILRNLIGNAIKFTNINGSINVQVEDAEYCLISISDNGIGISPEKQEKIFKPEKREDVKTPGTAGELSTGLGLVLCKEFTEKLSGTIWCESEVGIGTKFSFTIPKKIRIH